MPEELKMLLATLAKAAAEGKVVVGSADDMPKELRDIIGNSIADLAEHHEEMHKIAALSKELGDDMKSAIVAASKAFAKANGLSEEQFLDYVIYGAIANTLKFVLNDEDDDEDDDDECDCCHCQPPKNSPSSDDSANPEFDPDAAFAAINALKTILGNKRG
jgi:hypothetical protein